MADKCKGCGAPIVARFAELTGGICTSCARKATTPGQEIPAKVKRIVTVRGNTQATDQAKQRAGYSGHGRNEGAHLMPSAPLAKREAASSGHTGVTTNPETVSESYSEHLTFRLTPSMLQQIENAVGVKWTSIPELIREAIRTLLARES